MFGFGGAADECMVSKNQCPEQHIVHICSRNCVFISVMLKLMGFPGKYRGELKSPQPPGSYAYEVRGVSSQKKFSSLLCSTPNSKSAVQTATYHMQAPRLCCWQAVRATQSCLCFTCECSSQTRTLAWVIFPSDCVHITYYISVDL